MQEGGQMEEEEEVRSSEAAETFANQTFHSFQYIFIGKRCAFLFFSRDFFSPGRGTSPG